MTIILENQTQCDLCEEFIRTEEARIVCTGCFTAAQGIPPWRPIETAPKDGRYIIIYGGYSGGTVTMARWQEMQRKNSRWQSSSGHPVPREPTHWMSLPQAPEDE